MRTIRLLFFLMTLSAVHSQSVGKILVSVGGSPIGDSRISINFSLGEPVVGLVQDKLSVDQGFWAGSLTVTSLQTADEAGGIVIYPNPVEASLNIFTNGERVVGVTLFAVNGKRVWKERVAASQREHRINVTHLSKGTYILRLFVEGKSEEKLFKIIKE